MARLGVDVDELEVRATSEASARLAAQADGQPRVKKKTSRGSKGKKYKMTGDQMAAAERRDNWGDQGGAGGGGGLSQLRGS